MQKTKWTLDAAHSEIQFKVRHLMVSWITGSFKQFDASVETDGQDLTTAKVNFSAAIKSISTNNEQRDAHLHSKDFFDADTYPQLTYESNRLLKLNDEKYTMDGVLTMRGISKPLQLNVEFGGVMKDPWGNTKAGFTITGKLSRKEFDVSFTMLSETGGVLLGDEVTITANVEFVLANQ
jgi:polyisoprenoid-binding protein YceI